MMHRRPHVTCTTVTCTTMLTNPCTNAHKALAHRSHLSSVGSHACTCVFCGSTTVTVGAFCLAVAQRCTTAALVQCAPKQVQSLHTARDLYHISYYVTCASSAEHHHEPRHSVVIRLRVGTPELEVPVLRSARNDQRSRQGADPRAGSGEAGQRTRGQGRAGRKTTGEG